VDESLRRYLISWSEALQKGYILSYIDFALTQLATLIESLFNVFAENYLHNGVVAVVHDIKTFSNDELHKCWTILILKNMKYIGEKIVKMRAMENHEKITEFNNRMDTFAFQFKFGSQDEFWKYLCKISKQLEDSNSLDSNPSYMGSFSFDQAVVMLRNIAGHEPSINKDYIFSAVRLVVNYFGNGNYAAYWEDAKEINTIANSTQF
jgi:hypothetical protein